MNKNPLGKFLSLFILGAVCFIAGIITAPLLKIPGSLDNSTVLRAGKGEYKYINPLLLCQNYESGEATEFAPLKKEYERITSIEQNKNNIALGSVYFRELTSGKWTGINENEPHTPASLLKVPILIAYLKASEKYPATLGEKIYYKQEPGQTPPLVNDLFLKSGNTYTVENLLRGMIIDSDNSAKNILESRMNKTFLTEVYSELGIPSPYYGPNTGRDEYKISTKVYALFFRILYNATFLNRGMSEKAFDILSEVKFDKGLRAGTPKDIQVAHKYGFAILKKDEPRIIELSDCGVIYTPDAPRLLCVMARGNNPDTVSDYIKNITIATHTFLGSK